VPNFESSDKNIGDTFSVCLMAHNEENNIRGLVEDALNIFAQDPKLIEILIIDNASTDNTSKISSELAKFHPVVKHVKIKTNSFYAGGCREALLQAQGRYVFILDGDQQHPISQIAKFQDALNCGADIVFGNRVTRAEPATRIFSSCVLKVLARIILGFSGPDVNCGIRGVRLEVVPKILPEIKANFVNPEIYRRGMHHNLRIVFVDIDQLPRPDQALRPTTHNFRTPAKLLYQVIQYLISVRKAVLREFPS
jgi:glycosyltransferase involved in cell wall biosynthesis